MSSLTHKNKLFGDSGCLSLYAIEQYQTLALSEEEVALVDEHLNICPLCTDALEGLSLLDHRKDSTEEKVQSIKYSKEISLNISQEPFGYSAYGDKTNRINYKLRRTFNYSPILKSKKRKTPMIRHLWIPAAASIIVFVAVISYFHYFFPEQQELARIEATETDALTEEREISPALTTDSGNYDEVKKFEHIEAVEYDKEEESEERISEPEALPVLTETSEQTLGGIVMETPLKSDNEDAPTEPADEIIIEEFDELTEAEVNYSMEEMAGAGVSEKSVRIAKGRAKGVQDDQDDSPIFTVVEQMPEFPGGEDSLNLYIRKNLVFPDTDDPSHTKTIQLTFIINEKGIISNIQVLPGIGNAFQEEAINLVKRMPPWKPGRQRGRAVRVQYNLSITFERLQ